MAATRAIERALARARRLSPVVRRGGYEALSRRYDDLYQDYLAANHARHVFETWVPPGHFYSPYPDLDEIEDRAADIFDDGADLPGVDLRVAEQIELFDTLAELAADLPFPAGRKDGYRYFLDNPAYAWADGIILHAMLRHIRPSRIIEVGSGYSSAMILDTAEGWLDEDAEGGAVDVRFIEPYPELLHRLLRPGDEERVAIDEKPVQDIDPAVFDTLRSGDILFIDSTHVVKAGSDVNHLFFHVLPRLAEGVWVHVHDVFQPFEYPEPWVREGRAWQEAYLLRAFLMYNDRFEVRWFQDYMWKHHRLLLETRLPALAKNPGGNIWLQRSTRP